MKPRKTKRRVKRRKRSGRLTHDQFRARVLHAAKRGTPGSRFRKTLDRGQKHCAKKLGEEAVEAAIEAANGNKKLLLRELADLEAQKILVLESHGLTNDDLYAEFSRF